MNTITFRWICEHKRGPSTRVIGDPSVMGLEALSPLMREQKAYLHTCAPCGEGLNAGGVALIYVIEPEYTDIVRIANETPS